jgi:hypothetical protein
MGMPARLPNPRLRASIIAAALACAALAPAAARADASDPTNPLAGHRQFLNCDEAHQSGQAWRPWQAAYQAGNATERNLLLKIARVPTVKWFAGTPTSKIGRRMERYMANVDHPQYGGTMCATFLADDYSPLQWSAGPMSLRDRDRYVGDYPILAIRALDYDHCAGAPDPEAPYAPYKAWVDSFVAQLGRTYDSTAPYRYWDKYPAPGTHWRTYPEREAAVIVEPDMLGRLSAHSNCYTAAGKRKALALMRYAVTRLTTLPNVAVYIDAGEPTWPTVGESIRFLRAAGIAKARGFVENATHFGATKRNVRYGNRIAKRLHKHFIVNTSQNAHGLLPKRIWSHKSRLIPVPGSNNTNCNPPNAGLGTQPTTHTGHKRVDAYLWISRAGLSSNNHNRCGRGPAANVWYQEQALLEARQANFKSAYWPPRPL